MERAAPTHADQAPAEPHDAPVRPDAPVSLLVCVTCGARPDGDGNTAGAALHAAAMVATEGEACVRVASVKCLANCKRALSAAITRADGWSYVFGDLGADSAADLVTGARLLSASADGLMPWRGRPDSLKRGMVARLPPFAIPVPPVEEPS